MSLQESILKNLVDKKIKSILEKKQNEYGSIKYLEELDTLIDEIKNLKNSLRKGPGRLKHRKEVHRLQDAIGAIKYLKNIARKEGIKKGLLSEGGLKLSPEDRVKLTPAIASSAISVYENLIDRWNSYLEKNSTPIVKKIGPVGSSAYVSKDLEQGRNESYGDIDYLVSFPVSGIEGDNFRKIERDSKKKYEELFVNFLTTEMPKEVDVEKTLKPGSSPTMVIVKLPDETFVQVDTIITHPEYNEWMKGRYTPERGIKGYTIGNLYKSLGDYLVMTIGTDGVLVRTKQGERVSSRFSRSKGVETSRITTDISRFLIDIAKYLVSEDLRPNSLLSANPGTDSENVKILSLASGIKGLALTLEDHGVYNAKEMIDWIKSMNSKNMRSNVESKKKRGLDEDSYQKLLNLNEKIIKLVDEEISL